MFLLSSNLIRIQPFVFSVNPFKGADDEEEEEELFVVIEGDQFYHLYGLNSCQRRRDRRQGNRSLQGVKSGIEMLYLRHVVVLLLLRCW